MRHIYAAILCNLLFQVIGGIAWAESEGSKPDEAAAKAVVSHFIESVSSYQASFEQTLAAQDGEVLETESGQLWLQRPGQFRWNYTDPWQREIVGNTDAIWLYDAELQQVTVQSAAGALQNTPAALLVGDMSSLDKYHFSQQTEPEGRTRVRMEPHDTSGDFASIDMVFVDDLLVSLVLFDRFDQQTRIELTSVIANPTLDPAIFEFIPPEDADIIDQRQEAE